MDDAELSSLLHDLESDRVERKASDTDRERIAEAICAFANDLPDHRKSGVVFIGANNDGSSAGLAITDRLLQRIADLRSNGNIHPFPFMTVEKRTIGDDEIVVVEVRPSDNPPVQYSGRTWIRIGSRRAIATHEVGKDFRKLAHKIVERTMAMTR